MGSPDGGSAGVPDPGESDLSPAPRPADGVPPLGVVLAGGQSSRYGAPKALATVGGVPIIERVVRALGRVTPDLAVSANEPALFDHLGLPILPDDRPGLGPLAGILTTLIRARDEGRPGILAVACDMPFPSPALLALLSSTAFGHPGPPGSGSTAGTDPGALAIPADGPRPDVVAPASAGRRGLEPLFAAYSVGCIEGISAALEAGDRRMVGFHDRVAVRTIPLSAVRAICDPARAFLNVNTGEDRDRAEAMVHEDERGEGG